MQIILSQDTNPSTSAKNFGVSLAIAKQISLALLSSKLDYAVAFSFTTLQEDISLNYRTASLEK